MPFVVGVNNLCNHSMGRISVEYGFNTIDLLERIAQ